VTTIELYHETFGSPGRQTPLLLVHGGAGTIGTNWGHAIPTFAADRLVIGVELQGHGHTRHAARAYTFENSADDIAVLVRELGIERVDIMGFSNGGPTTMRFALRHADLTRRVVVATGFYRRDGMIEGFWDNFDDPQLDSMPAVLKQAYSAINPDPADLYAMFQLDVSLMRDFRDWDDQELAALKAPVLFISGDHDVVIPEHTIRMARLAPHGRALVVPAGHGDYLGAADAGDVDAELARSCLGLIHRFFDESDS
jgi:pimeloyl-ACP methyl ester carboxylesterase